MIQPLLPSIFDAAVCEQSNAQDIHPASCSEELSHYIQAQMNELLTSMDSAAHLKDQEAREESLRHHAGLLRDEEQWEVHMFHVFCGSHSKESRWLQRSS